MRAGDWRSRGAAAPGDVHCVLYASYLEIGTLAIIFACVMYVVRLSLLLLLLSFCIQHNSIGIADAGGCG